MIKIFLNIHCIFRIPFSTSVLLLIPFLVNAQSLREKVNTGNEHYNKSEYELAINKYKDALLKTSFENVSQKEYAEQLQKFNKAKSFPLYFHQMKQ